MGESGLPKVATSLDRYFDPAYYAGAVPVFDPSIYHTTREGYEYGWPEAAPQGGAFDYPKRAEAGGEPRVSALDDHQFVARSCEKPVAFRRVHIKGGTDFAREGEVFGFAPRVIEAGRCEEIEVVFENRDAMRHALMLPGLNPMFALEFVGPGSRTARFVTPDEDVTLEFHCHVETHDKMGMHGRLIVGKGGAAVAKAAAVERKIFEGIGVVVSLEPRKGRLVIDHEEIADFMAPMVMSYAVMPPSLLQGLAPGTKVRFGIDSKLRAIVAIQPLAAE